MYRMLEGTFGHQGLAVSTEPRVYELTGHFGALGVVAVVLGVLLWAAVMTALVLVVIELVQRRRRPQAAPPLQQSQHVPAPPGPVLGRDAMRAASEALRILDERYARGELSHDEYVERKGDLSG